MKKHIYSKEFKEQTIRLNYQRDNIKELADGLSLDHQRIYNGENLLNKEALLKQKK